LYEVIALYSSRYQIRLSFALFNFVNDQTGSTSQNELTLTFSIFSTQPLLNIYDGIAFRYSEFDDRRTNTLGKRFPNVTGSRSGHKPTINSSRFNSFKSLRTYTSIKCAVSREFCHHLVEHRDGPLIVRIINLFTWVGISPTHAVLVIP